MSCINAIQSCCYYLNPINYCPSSNQSERVLTKSEDSDSAKLTTPNSTHAKSFREFFPVNCRNLCSSAGLKHFFWFAPSAVGGTASGGGTYAILACATKASTLTALETAGIVAGASIAGAGALGVTAAFSSYAIYRCILRCSSNSDNQLTSKSDEEKEISPHQTLGYGTIATGARITTGATGTTAIDIPQEDGEKEDEKPNSLPAGFTGSHTSGEILKDPSSTSTSTSSMKVDNSHNTTN